MRDNGVSLDIRQATFHDRDPIRLFDQVIVGRRHLLQRDANILVSSFFGKLPHLQGAPRKIITLFACGHYPVDTLSFIKTPA